MHGRRTRSRSRTGGRSRHYKQVGGPVQGGKTRHYKQVGGPVQGGRSRSRSRH